MIAFFIVFYLLPQLPSQSLHSDGDHVVSMIPLGWAITIAVAVGSCIARLVLLHGGSKEMDSYKSLHTGSVQLAAPGPS